MKRRKFSETDVLRTVQFLLWRVSDELNLVCFRCQGPLFLQLRSAESNLVAAIAEDKIEREHYIELSLGGEDEPRNCVYSHATCHNRITNGTKATTAGSSKHKIAKVNRITGKTKNKPKAKIKSRPFPKRIKKDGRS